MSLVDGRTVGRADLRFFILAGPVSMLLASTFDGFVMCICAASKWENSPLVDTHFSWASRHQDPELAP
jgi:hypothetical protein